jgi:RNA polymerase sigma factor (sigma-70 family)
VAPQGSIWENADYPTEKDLADDRTTGTAQGLRPMTDQSDDDVPRRNWPADEARAHCEESAAEWRQQVAWLLAEATSLRVSGALMAQASVGKSATLLEARIFQARLHLVACGQAPTCNHAAQTATLDFSQFAVEVTPRLVAVVRAIVAHVCPYLAEDIVQAALIAIWGRWTKKGPPDNPHAYAMVTAVRCARRAVDAEKRLLTIPISDDNQVRSLSGCGEIEAAVLRIDLDTAIRRLTPRQRAIFRQYLAGRSYDEIAEFFTISSGTVAKQLHLARKALRLFLAGRQEA